MDSSLRKRKLWLAPRCLGVDRRASRARVLVVSRAPTALGLICGFKENLVGIASFDADLTGASRASALSGPSKGAELMRCAARVALASRNNRIIPVQLRASRARFRAKVTLRASHRRPALSASCGDALELTPCDTRETLVFSPCAGFGGQEVASADRLGTPTLASPQKLQPVLPERGPCKLLERMPTFAQIRPTLAEISPFGRIRRAEFGPT